jgi:hypothetical protein
LKQSSLSPNSEVFSSEYVATDELVVDEETGDLIKRRSQLVTPRRNTETLVAHPPSPHDKDVRIKHELEPHGGLAALQAKGLKITSYTETDGAGRPIINRKWYDEE